MYLGVWIWLGGYNMDQLCIWVYRYDQVGITWISYVSGCMDMTRWVLHGSCWRWKYHKFEQFFPKIVLFTIKGTNINKCHQKVSDVLSIAFNSKCSDLNSFPLSQINYNYWEECSSRLINNMLVYDYDGHQPSSTHISNVMEVTFICLILKNFSRMKCSFSWI